VRTLLVIDDDPTWRLLYRLEFEGRFRVIEAADGEEGLRRYDETSPDLVIVDLRMPRMDGAAFLEHLQGKPQVAPVIVCSAVSDEAESLVRPGLRGVRIVSKWPNLRELRQVVLSLTPEPLVPDPGPAPDRPA